MLILKRNRLFFRTMEIYFADAPFEVENCDLVSFIECKNEIKNTDFEHKKSCTAVINLSPNINCIWHTIDKKSNRQRINRAIKDGVSIHKNSNYHEFSAIYKNFMRDKGFKSLLGIGTPTISEMKNSTTLFVAKHNNEVLAGHLYLEGNDTFRLWASASKRLSVSKEQSSLIGKANRLLHWEAIKYAKEKEFREYDWGGVWTDNETKNDIMKLNLNTFKLSFGSQIIERHSYYKTYSTLYNVSRSAYQKIKGQFEKTKRESDESKAT